MELSAPGWTGGSRPGQVVRTSLALEPGSRTLRTEIDWLNPDQSLRPGMFVTGRIKIQFPPQLSLPANAIGKINEEPVAYLVVGDQVVRVVLELLRGDAQHTQVTRFRRGATGSP